MKELKQALQIATIFIGSIVGAGLSSGRELSQFFSIYGYKSFIGLIFCALAYVSVGKMIVELSMKHNVKSYDAFIDLVCPKPIAWCTNLILTLFLLSSTSIILAGSCAVIHQYFGVPKWIGFLLMVGCSIVFLLKNTEGLFEVNGFVVPLLLIIMTSIFLGYISKRSYQLEPSFLAQLGATKTNWFGSAITYAGFNLISIVGVLVPLAQELQDGKSLYRGIVLGSILLTVLSFFITFLMMVNPNYPQQYEIPILAVTRPMAKALQVGLLLVIWLEMFSSQISNIYSLTKCLEHSFHVTYKKGIFLTLAVAAPFAGIGFSKLVDVLYPLYGVLSLGFIGCCIWFYFASKSYKGATFFSRR
jgi:uncharacterized membrane protein YkvI